MIDAIPSDVGGVEAPMFVAVEVILVGTLCKCGSTTKDSMFLYVGINGG